MASSAAAPALSPRGGRRPEGGPPPPSGYAYPPPPPHEGYEPYAGGRPPYPPPRSGYGYGPPPPGSASSYRGGPPGPHDYWYDYPPPPPPHSRAGWSGASGHPSSYPPPPPPYHPGEGEPPMMPPPANRLPRGAPPYHREERLPYRPTNSSVGAVGGAPKRDYRYPYPPASPPDPRDGAYPPPPPGAEDTRSKPETQQDGDPLSVLADVSADMDSPSSKKHKKSAKSTDTEPKKGSTPAPPAPTSPLQRSSRTSRPTSPPATTAAATTSTPPQEDRRRGANTGSRAAAAGGSGPSDERAQITPNSSAPPGHRRHPSSADAGSWMAGNPWGPTPSTPGGIIGPSKSFDSWASPRKTYPGFPDHSGHPGSNPLMSPPALVERGSFDSLADSPGGGYPPRADRAFWPQTPPRSNATGAGYYPPTPYEDGERAPPVSASSSFAAKSWESPGRHHHHAPPPPHSYYPPSRSWGPPGGPPPEGDYYDYPPGRERPPPPGYPPRPPEDAYYPPPPPPYQGHYPPPPHSSYEGHPPPPPGAPYEYSVQQPHLEERTILRKKFSWKHYPPLERFLIAHREEYLRHSQMNYTAEQKQYNNWLTEQLLDLAQRHNYVFDPEEFNFVSIRDRIRCYYKSYVQTARKRGIPLPALVTASKKVARTTGPAAVTPARPNKDEGKQEEENEAAKKEEKSSEVEGKEASDKKE